LHFYVSPGVCPHDKRMSEQSVNITGKT